MSNTMRLTVQPEKGVTEERELQPGEILIIGRAPECGLVLDFMNLSRTHCRIEHEDGHWVVYDLESSNGLHINEQRLERGEKRILFNHDIIRLGRCKLTISLQVPVDDATVIEHQDCTILEQHDQLHAYPHAILDKVQPGLQSVGVHSGQEIPISQLNSYDITKDMSRFFSNKERKKDAGVPSNTSQPSKNDEAPSNNFIKVISGPFTGQQFSIYDGCFVGRDAELCQVALNDRTISRQHLRLSINNKGSWMFECLAKENLILVNGNKANKGVINTGDSLQIGDCLLNVSLDSGSDDMKRGRQLSLKIVISAVIGILVVASFSIMMFSQGPLQPGGERIIDLSTQNVLKTVTDQESKTGNLSNKNETLQPGQSVSLVNQQSVNDENYQLHKTRIVEDVSSMLDETRKILKSGDILAASQKLASILPLPENLPANVMQSYAGIKDEVMKSLTAQIDRNIKEAQTCLNKKKFGCALESYQKVLDLQPDHALVKEKFNKLLEKQLLEAGKYFQSAVKYESANNMERAKEYWKLVISAIPLRTHPMNVKANENLAKYGNNAKHVNAHGN